MTTRGEALAHIDAALARKRSNESVAEEAARLAGSFREFIRAAWPIVVPVPFVKTWHVDTLADHVQAAYEREIPRLLITIQPGSLKSTIITVLGPAWRWTHAPEERFVTASHSDDLSTRDTRRSRMLMQTEWFQQRWPIEFSGDENLKTRYSNVVNGHRIRTHVGGGTGDRGTVLQVDDPHNAKEAQSDTQLSGAIEWWSDTWSSRLDDGVDARGVKIVVGQRIHRDDLIGHLLANDEDAGRWVHLCLPTEYESAHPFVYPASRTLPSGRVIQGDPRTDDGELLMPAYQDRDRLADRTADMTAHVYAGQYQQRPSAKEGRLLKRFLWRYYNPEWSFYAGRGTFDRTVAAEHLPTFTSVVHSWDTSVKDRAKSDYVAGGVWGCEGANRWLLRLYHQRAGLNATIEAMLALRAWAGDVWPHVPQWILVEESANGPDAIAEIQSRVEGVIAIPARGTKYARAEAASPALDGRNMFLPGYANATGDDYDTRTPKDVQDMVEELSEFDVGPHDDQVDMWSQMVNWTRQHGDQRGSVGRVRAPRKPRPRALHG